MIGKDDFLKLGRARQKVLFLPADAGQVMIRSLTGEEVLSLGDVSGGRPAQAAFMLAAGLVEPALTVDEARTFIAEADHELCTFIIEAINELSGLAEGAQKSD